MIDKIRDWKIPFAQTILPLIFCPLVLLININGLLAKADVSVKDLDVVWRIIIGLGKPVLVIAIMFLYCNTIRKVNKGTVLKQNVPNKIVWHTMAGYWFCRYILSFQKVSLTRVPIPMQFKLVWSDWFTDYEIMDGVAEKEKGTDNINVKKFNDDQVTSTVNLVLADTYPLNWKEKLPADLLNLTTIVIERGGEKGVRYYSPDFVAEISRIVHELPINVVGVNLFATINAANSYHIANEVFKTGGRDNLKHLRVYEQSKDNWVFEGKYKKIF